MMRDPPAGIATPPTSESELRWVLRRALVATCFGVAWGALTSGATQTRFAKSMGLDEFGFGVLAAIPYLAACAQVPASLFIERYGHRKPLILWLGLSHRIIWLAIAAMPWLLPPGARPFCFVSLLGLSAIAGQATGPAWVSWLADIIPARLRGRYASRRSQAGQLVNLALFIGAGLALDWAEARSGVALGRMLSLLLAVGALLGITDLLLYLKVPDRASHPRNAKLSLKELILQPLQNRSFRFYLGFTSTLTFATGFVGQFIWLYLFDVLKVSNTKANLLLVTGPVLASLVGLPFWGRMIDRLGRKPVAIITALGIVPGAAVWLLVSPDRIFPGYLGVMFCAFVWPGVDLVNFNILLGLVERRGVVGQNTAYVAVNSLVIAIAGVLSGVFGGLIAKWLAHWHGAFLGLALTYHGVLFLLSGVFRLLAVPWLHGIDDPRAFSARNAIRYMVADVYSNLQNTIAIPVRLAGRVTYKLSTIRWVRFPRD
jgi:MFS family permease